MKARLNVTIDKAVLDEIKYYAEMNNISISALIEEYLKTIVRKPGKNSFLDKIRRLPKAAIDENIDLTRVYYDEKYR